MISKTLLSTTIAASLVILPATRAAADAGDFVAGAIVGAIVNHAARNNRGTTKKVYRSTKRKTYSKPRIPATQTGRQIQSSLNYFGFNAGSVDGQLGRKSRDAISQYQAYLGYPVTGQLSSFEQDLLINSYNRAQAGGYVTQQQVAANPEGVRGLLKVYRTEMAGGAPGIVTAPQTTVVVAPAAAATTTTTTTVTAMAGDEAPKSDALPNLFGGTTTRASLASHCNTVSLLTNTNGGFTTVGTMTDPNVALNEQFCLARTYAIAEGESLAQGLGATPEQIASHCDAYGEQMKPHVAALSLKDRDSVVRDVSGFVLGTGIPTQDLAATAKVCLSVGYRTDDLDVAIGSALILVTLGETGYGELMGHHLSQGFGASKRNDLALAWYETGLDGATTQAVFAPGQPERLELLREASFALQNGGQASATPQVVPQKAATLPAFSVSQ
ncbi:peptidoglycan-binding domain-containing protein [Oceaniglobus trochenteri]|uniref:peptidoglycan-binding domain-containing protein n=1 Tax=Oceaniglobus trochenteri TaxID=2763260 RepID=UPI001CFF7412|nr:peptidoglycan-binding domain-containing protein [Oceaniglobus trochenteri]